MNYFDLFEIPISLNIDKSVLKRKFFALSRLYHPDNFINEDEIIKEEALTKSSEINKAYNILKDRFRRIQYILTITDTLGQAKELLPPTFLMQMMDINEKIDTLQNAPVKDMQTVLLSEIDNLESELNLSIENIEYQVSIDISSTSDLNKLKDFYLKMKYVLRIKENLHTFAIQ